MADEGGQEPTIDPDRITNVTNEEEECGCDDIDAEDEVKGTVDIEDAVDVEDTGKKYSERCEDSGSYFRFDRCIDATVTRELRSAERQAQETATNICGLKRCLKHLLQKEKLTKGEASELEDTNKELKKEITDFEEKTKRIRFLCGQNDLFGEMVRPSGIVQMKHKEDALPKVIICGVTDNNIPKLIVCEDRKVKDRTSCPRICISQERVEVDEMNCRLQSDLVYKNMAIEELQRALGMIQRDMHMISQENSMLNYRIREVFNQKMQEAQSTQCGRDTNMLVNHLNECFRNSKDLEQQISDIEYDMSNMENDLCVAQQTQTDIMGQCGQTMMCPPLYRPSAENYCTSTILFRTDQLLQKLKQRYGGFQGKGCRSEKLNTVGRDIEEMARKVKSLRGVAAERSRNYFCG